jgi:hypothetical protein
VSQSGFYWHIPHACFFFQLHPEVSQFLAYFAVIDRCTSVRLPFFQEDTICDMSVTSEIPVRVVQSASQTASPPGNGRWAMGDGTTGNYILAASF